MPSREASYRSEIQQMMFIAGETNEASEETIMIIENHVREQAIEMIKFALELARRRGVSLFTNNDLLFQIRKDSARMERVRAFLTWKIIRRRAKDDDEKEDIDDAVVVEDEPEEEPIDPTNPRTAKIPALTLPWDVGSMFSVQFPEETTIDDIIGPASLEKLRRNDARTKGMNVKEYATWAEYRHASFVGKKPKRFREWVGLGKIGDYKANEDVLDILGFLTSEMVQNITAEALKVQAAENPGRMQLQQAQAKVQARRRGFMLAQSTDERPPIQPSHVRSALYAMQSRTMKKSVFRGGKARQRMSLMPIGYVGIGSIDAPLHPSGGFDIDL